MIKFPRFLYVVAALVAIFVNACGGVPTSNTSVGSDKPLASLVEFTGVIEAIDGNQWTVNGQVITVDPSVLRDGPFEIGDTVKVEAEVQADGSFVVTRVEPSVAGLDDNNNSSLDNSNVNSNDNTNSSMDINSNDNSNDDNSNDDDSIDNSNDDNSNEDDNLNDDNSNDDDSDDDSSGSGSGSDDSGGQGGG